MQNSIIITCVQPQFKFLLWISAACISCFTSENNPFTLTFLTSLSNNPLTCKNLIKNRSWNQVTDINFLFLLRHAQPQSFLWSYQLPKLMYQLPAALWFQLTQNISFNAPPGTAWDISQRSLCVIWRCQANLRSDNETRLLHSYRESWTLHIKCIWGGGVGSADSQVERKDTMGKMEISELCMKN